MDSLTITLIQHPHSHPRPPQSPLICSSSHHLNFTTTLISRSRSRCDRDRIISHAVRAPSFNFNPRRFTNDDNNNDDDDDDDDEEEKEFVRRKRKSGRRSKQRRWLSNEAEDDEPIGGIIEQAVDNLWILQVFRSYGLFLPVILISLLLATGPKAFLMGSGIPFGLSALVFAFKKLSGWIYGNTKPKRKRRRKSSFGGKVDDQGDRSQEGKNSNRRAYKTRVARDDRQFYDDNPDNDSVNDFGGWDELVGEEEAMSTQTPSQPKDRLEMMTEKVRSKSKPKLKEKDVPVFLRLLIAVFPFLGSWTNLL